MMSRSRIAYLRGELEAERIDLVELNEIEAAFAALDPATLSDRPENAAASDMLDELEVSAGAGLMALGMTRKRSDGRLEVADHAEADDTYGCQRDSWCILADGHEGDCCDDREVWAGPDELYRGEGEE